LFARKNPLENGFSLFEDVFSPSRDRLLGRCYLNVIAVSTSPVSKGDSCGEGNRGKKKKDRTSESSVLIKGIRLKRCYASLFRRFRNSPIKRPTTTTREIWRGSGTVLVAVKLSWLEYVVVKLVEEASSSGVSFEMDALKLPATSLTLVPSVAVPETKRRALVPLPTAVRMIGDGPKGVSGEQDSPVVNPAQSVFELPGPNESSVMLRLGSSGNETVAGSVDGVTSTPPPMSTG
jgi:hypothetical protein